MLEKLTCICIEEIPTMWLAAVRIVLVISRVKHSIGIVKTQISYAMKAELVLTCSDAQNVQ